MIAFMPWELYRGETRWGSWQGELSLALLRLHHHHGCNKEQKPETEGIMRNWLRR